MAGAETLMLMQTSPSTNPVVRTAKKVEAIPAATTKLSLLQCLKRDASRYGACTKWYRELGFWVGATYRFGVWARKLPFPIRLPLMMLYRVFNRVWRLVLHVNISAEAVIGPGLCLIHPTNILIPATRIGEDLLIFHDVTIGSNMHTSGWPSIGNHVDLYAGARLLGDIVIGDGAKIGANCVVTSNIKPGSIVAPAPIRVLNRSC
jgi:serine O-acetyltransferase